MRNRPMVRQPVKGSLLSGWRPTIAAVPGHPPRIQPMPYQRTFVMVKPDGVRRRLVGEVVSRFEAKGLVLERIEMMVPDEETAARHYEEHRSRDFYSSLIAFITSGPVVAMQWSGESAVTVARTMMGTTNPVTALPGTIRGDYGLNVQENIVHGSDGPESAERELRLWFGEG